MHFGLPDIKYQPDPSGTGGNQNPLYGANTTQAGINAGGQVATGALAGAFPNVGKTTSQGNTTNVSTGSTSSNASSQLQNYLNTIANLFGSSSNRGTSTTAPNLTPQMQAFLNNLTGRANTLTAPSLVGYTAGQTSNINQNADLQKQAVGNIMAARGLSTSPVAATAQSGIEQNRINQITQMQEQVPVLQNQLQLQNTAQAAQIANLLPGLTGQTQAFTTDQQQQQQQTGQSSQNQFSESWQNLFNFLQSIGTNYQTQNTTSGGGVGGAISGAAQGLAQALPYLAAAASDKRLKKDIKSLSQDKAIEKVRELNAKTWKWKGGDRSDSGLIAQEVEKVLPDATDTININGTDVKAINYAAVIPYLVGAIQNLDSRIGV